MLRYEYSLQNVGGANETLTQFVIAIDDVNPLNYQNVTAPAGWIYMGVQSAPLQVVKETKTPHMGISPGPPVPSAGSLLWTHSGDLLGPGLTRGTFGFNNPNNSEDGSWIVAGTPGGATTWTVPVAGPLGTYTDGPIHVPVPEPVSTAMLVAGTLMILPIYRFWKSSK